MPTVEEDIQFLIQIVKKDMEIKEKKKLLDAIPPRIKAIDREIQKMDESLGDTKHIIEKLDAEKRHIESELKTHHAELEKKKEEQRVIRDNKLYRAIMLEMEYINKKVDQAEERMLAILDEGEVRRNEIRILNEKMSVETERAGRRKGQTREGSERRGRRPEDPRGREASHSPAHIRGYPPPVRADQDGEGRFGRREYHGGYLPGLLLAGASPEGVRGAEERPDHELRGMRQDPRSL